MTSRGSGLDLYFIDAERRSRGGDDKHIHLQRMRANFDSLTRRKSCTAARTLHDGRCPTAWSMPRLERMTPRFGRPKTEND